MAEAISDPHEQSKIEHEKSAMLANRQTAAGHHAETLRAAVSIRLYPKLITAVTTISALIQITVSGSVSPVVSSCIVQSFVVTVIGGL